MLLDSTQYSAPAHESRVRYVKPPEGIMQRKLWMGELKYTVMDGCMLLNKLEVPQRVISKNCKERKRQAVIFRGVRNLTLTVEKLKRVHKLATGACKNSIFFAVDNFPPCIPVTICPQYRALVAGQPEAAPFGPCCSCTFYWTRDAFLKFSQSYDMVGWQ